MLLTFHPCCLSCGVHVILEEDSSIVGTLGISGVISQCRHRTRRVAVRFAVAVAPTTCTCGRVGGQCCIQLLTSQHLQCTCHMQSSVPWWHNRQCLPTLWLDVAMCSYGCLSIQTKYCIMLPHLVQGRRAAPYQYHPSLPVHVGPTHACTNCCHRSWSPNGDWSLPRSHLSWNGV